MKWVLMIGLLSLVNMIYYGVDEGMAVVSRPPFPRVSPNMAPMEAITTSRNIVVDKYGRGSHRTIQGAIDSVPKGNKEWVHIHVHAGYYM